MVQRKDLASRTALNAVHQSLVMPEACGGLVATAVMGFSSSIRGTYENMEACETSEEYSCITNRTSLVFQQGIPTFWLLMGVPAQTCASLHIESTLK